MMMSRQLGSVSSVALASVAASVVAADQADAQGFTLTLEGGAGDAIDGFTIDGEERDTGPFGSISLSGQFGMIDGTISITSFNQSNRWEEGTSDGGSGASSYAGEDVEFLFLDMMTSYGLGGDSAPFELMYGIRALDTRYAFHVGGESFAGTNAAGFDAATSEEFMGLGPRIAVRYDTGRMGDSGGFGFSAELGASVLFGQSVERGEISTFQSDSIGTIRVGGSDSITETTTISTLDLALRASYYFTQSSQMFIGFQVMENFGLGDGEVDSSGQTQQFTIGFSTEF